MATALFWIFAGLLIYVYAGYPLLVRALACLMERPVNRAPGFRKTVTVVICAFNEEKSIQKKISNVLDLHYPQDLLDIIVVSDASNDRTDAMVRSLGIANVQLLRVEGRLGKTACQNAAIVRARGDIVVFTDATTHIDGSALDSMVENFADPDVGCVAGMLVYQGSGDNLTAAGGTTYWSYEVGVRSAESRLGSLIGVSGCLYAVRREAYRPIPPNLISDFVIAMKMREQGLRTVLESRAICFEDTLDHSGRELSMRVRVAVRSIAALVAERRFLNFVTDPVFAWELWSHKLLRYASPYFLLGMLATSMALAARPLYDVFLAMQLALLGAGLAGFALQITSKRMGLLSKPYYFLLTNVASMIASIRYVTGARMVTWNPIR